MHRIGQQTQENFHPSVCRRGDFRLMGSSESASTKTWRTVGGDLSDEEWELIADLLDQPVSPSKMRRPLKHSRRDGTWEKVGDRLRQEPSGRDH